MSIRRLSIYIVISLLVCLSVAPTMLVSAQEMVPPNTLSLSEAQINQALRENNQNAANDLSIDLQPGQFVVNLVATGPQGNTNRLGLTLVPAVVAGRLDINATRLTINEIQLNLNNNPAANAATGAINDYLTEQTEGGQIQNIAITEDVLQISWHNPDPNGPIVTIQDHLFSLTFTEAAINNMPSVTNPTGPNVSAIDWATARAC